MQQDSTTHGNGSTAIDARFSASFKLPQSNVTRNDFSSLAQSIGNNTQKISYNTTQLRKYVDQLGTEADTERMREKLHRLQNVNNQLAKDTNEIFKQISDLPVGDQKEQQHRKIHIRRLKEEFSAVLQEFQKLQREATGKEKESVARARVNSDFGPSSITWSYAPDVPGIHSSPPSTKDSSLQQTQQQVYEIEESVDLAIIEEREKGIQQLEKDINDINEIFRDLAQMVNEQGEQIDVIEENVIAAADNVEEGVKELKEAQSLQEKLRAKKCCIIITLIIVLIAVTLAVVLPILLTKKK